MVNISGCMAKIIIVYIPLAYFFPPTYSDPRELETGCGFLSEPERNWTETDKVSQLKLHLKAPLDNLACDIDG
jgi:hypothetical protein